MTEKIALSRRACLGLLGASSVIPLAARAAEGFTLRLNLAEDSSSAAATCGVRLAQAVARRTNGQLKVEVYPNLQLAKEREAIDGLTTGTVDLAIQSSGFLVPLFPKFQVFDMPFLFKNAAVGFRVFDGPIGNELFADLEPRGIVGLGYGIGGFRELETTSKPVVTPDDLKGLRIRVLNSPLYVSLFQALGAVPVTGSEMFVALQQRTIDGIDINLDGFTSFKGYNIVKHVAMTNHVLSLLPLIGGKRKIESMPVALQKVLREEVKAMIPQWRSLTLKQTADDVDFLKKNGVTFTDIQYPAFRKLVDPVYATVQAKVGADFLNRINRAASTG